MSEPLLLDVRDLTVGLQTPAGPAQAVRQVSFQLERGETLGLVGESGCGKSITAMALMGLLPERSELTGSIRFLGQELVGMEDRALCRIRGDRIGMIFQEPMTALNPVHTIGDQVAEPLRLHRRMQAAQARQRAIELLDRVGIPQAARRVDAYPHQFSGGQRQRITIAMALACEPALLIADEPTTALDVTVAGQILELIRELVRERSMGLILISHDLGVIASHVNRMLVMYGGTVVENGPTREVFTQRAHPYTRGLFASRPQFGAQAHAGPGQRPRLPSIPGTVPELHLMPAGCAFSERCPQVRDDCRHRMPALQEVKPGHSARCVLIHSTEGLNA